MNSGVESWAMTEKKLTAEEKAIHAAAVALGARGGAKTLGITSEAKAAASRANAKKAHEALRRKREAAKKKGGRK